MPALALSVDSLIVKERVGVISRATIPYSIAQRIAQSKLEKRRRIKLSKKRALLKRKGLIPKSRENDLWYALHKSVRANEPLDSESGRGELHPPCAADPSIFALLRLLLAMTPKVGSVLRRWRGFAGSDSVPHSRTCHHTRFDMQSLHDDLQRYKDTRLRPYEAGPRRDGNNYQRVAQTRRALMIVNPCSFLSCCQGIRF
jgi:hypothetical protein